MSPWLKIWLIVISVALVFGYFRLEIAEQRLSEVEWSQRQLVRSTTLINELDSLLHRWNTGKLAILEAAIMAAADRDWRFRPFAYALADQDSVWSRRIWPLLEALEHDREPGVEPREEIPGTLDGNYWNPPGKSGEPRLEPVVEIWGGGR